MVFLIRFTFPAIFTYDQISDIPYMTIYAILLFILLLLCINEIRVVQYSQPNPH